MFNAGVGNCRDGGRIDLLYASIQEFYSGLEDKVLLYPGHDYLEKNLKFTEHISGKKFSTQTDLSFKREREINLFLQTKSFEEFRELRAKRDIF